jgi:hypothetical protein
MHTKPRARGKQRFPSHLQYLNQFLELFELIAKTGPVVADMMTG